MSNLRNSVRLIGNVGQTPEIKTLDKGQKVAKFSMATNEHYYDKAGQKVTNTYWHNLVAWGKTADIIENYVSKGQEIAIEGKLTNRNYQTKEGDTRYITEIVINEVALLGAKN